MSTTAQVSNKKLQRSAVLENIVNSLLQALSDSDETVKQTVITSLYDTGFRQPNPVLFLACEFINKNPKLDQAHRVQILKSILSILNETRDQIVDTLSLSLIQMAINEMTKDKEVVPEWQQAASSLLVSLGLRYPSQIMDELLKRFEPGTLPHYFIMKTLGDFIGSNPLPTVPRIRDILSRVLPVLATIKHDNFKWVFASTLGHIADAIVQYIANIDSAQDKTLTLYSFSAEFYPALEFMFNKWLTTNHEKVRLVTIEAIGSISSILAIEQLESQLSKIINGVLQMMKKEKDLLPVVHSIQCILSVCIKNDLKTNLDPLLQIIMSTLHPFACQTPDYTNPSSTKLFNEVLRCFETIGRGYSLELVAFLSQKLEIKDNKIKSGSLSILKHIVTRLDPELEDKKSLILSAIRPLIQTETSLFVKRSLVQVVISMASYGYLHLPGGESLVEYVIKGSSFIQDSEIGLKTVAAAQPKKPASSNPAEEVTEVEFRSICDNILHLITTTIPNMETVLWPYLFESLLPMDYTGSIAIVSKCLNFIALNKKANDSDDYYIDFDKEVNLPKPTQMIARFFVLLTAPHRRNQLGIRILEVMKSIGPILHPSICDMWDVTLPKLIVYLEDHPSPDAEDWNKNQWEELVLRLLSETIKNAADDEWTVHLGNSLSEQIDHYKRDPILKRSAYKQLGLIMQKSSHKEFVKSKLDQMFNTVDYTNALENEGCAVGFGYCSASHFDLVLEKIQFFIKNNMVKKSGFFKKSGPKGIKNCVLLMYGYAATYAPSALLASRVEVHIVSPIKPSISLLKKPLKKLSTIKMIDLIGKALHQDKVGNFVFRQRDELLKLVISYMNTPPPSVTNQVKIQGVSSCSTLIDLEPMIPIDLEQQLVNLLMVFYAIQPSKENLLNTESEEYKEVNELITNINTVFSTLLFNQTTIPTLQRLIQYLDPLSRSKDTHLRERSTYCILYIVKKYIEFTSESSQPPVDKKFDNIGTTISILIPRCADPEPNIRKYAVESLQLLLYIDFMLKHVTAEQRRIKPPEPLHPLTSIRESITTTEVNEQFSLVFDISMIIGRMISLDEIPRFLEGSIKGLTDLQTFSTNGTCIMINGLIKNRGQELLDYVPTLVKGLVAAMDGITSDTTMNGTLVSLRSLASHHLLPVVNVLLEYPMPHTLHVVKSLQIIAKDKNLVTETVNHLMDLLNNKPIYEEKPDPKNKNRTVPAPYIISLAATSSLGEILQLTEIEEHAKQYYQQLFSTMCLRAGTCNNSLPCVQESPIPKGKSTTLIPSTQLLVSFRQFFKAVKEDELLEKIEAKGSINQLESPAYPQALQDIIAQVAQVHPELLKSIYEFLIPYQRSNYIPHRIVTIAITAELINHSKDKELLQRLINTLLNSLVDPTIKLICLKGLSNIVSAGQEQTNRYAPTVIDALSTSIDDQDEVIAMECMLGLSKIFEIADEGRVAPILVNICNRIRPAFEKPNDSIRAASFQLFGSLWRFGSGSASDPFFEQIHNTLPALTMHLNDENAQVKDACKKSLRQLSALLRSEEIYTYFTRKSFDDDSTPNYDEFLSDFSKLFITYYPDRINFYIMTCLEFYKSNWQTLRANSATITGFILGNISEEKRSQTNINPAIIIKALVGLLAEKNPIVRKKAAESLGYLYSY
ncbi:hypothetical protein DLAC_10285 [Tieghemostelium lacteum]|uniref:HEAT repeat-containing protein n=1 Tax=Tieghemostelium lacteum TaxID=361077 RepID=A0A151Z508_TIELA|nr:hypothetical protein DLAC_10285 [Tieghemostelium lacteum]|eukprot:KYQ89059.1 hypothetical protein DLAC_10285 [Tieghemostelium lacteum]